MDGLSKIGPFLGQAGMLACLVSVVIRVNGNAVFMGYETLSFFIGGIGLMAIACVAKLYGKG